MIGEASVEFSDGLNVVTGETGVGKTLLVTSLALLTGGRGHARLVREGARQAVVQGVLALSGSVRDDIASFHAGDPDELVVVRRLSEDGRSRAWVGDQIVGVSALAEIGGRLVEIHGQTAAFALAKPATQLAAIVALARYDDVLMRYRTALSAWRELEREQASLRQTEETRQRESELLAFQIDEIDRAELQPDEDDDVAAALSRLEHAERLRSIGVHVGALTGAEGATGLLAEAHKELASAAEIDRGVAPLLDRLGALALETAELARELRSWSETLDADPAQLEALRERKAFIASLKRKYAGTIDDILSTAAAARERLEELTNADERIATIDQAVVAASVEVERCAEELTKRRRRAAKELSKLVASELPALALPQARFSVEHASTAPTEDGCDRFEFRFSSTSSRSPEPIEKIASGGELSRAMIAVTLALAHSHDIPILVFDEADQGIGGEAALELGRRLSRLARSHQVLVVSHLPQIAAFADRHIAVRRSGDDVRIDVLGGADRLSEISRMLAGLEGSKRARAHAAELLELAASERGAGADRARAG